jgi:iron complex transport system ATP-binding protein
MSLLSCHNLQVQISNTLVCNDLNLSFHAGENWAILGMNGCGKTTLLHTLAGLLPAVSGNIKINNSDINTLARRDIALQLSLLMQHQEDHFPASVIETILIGRHPHLKNWQWESDEDKKIANEALMLVGLNGFSERSIQTLSGGERQRVALATLLTQKTRIRLVDEPVNHLDIHQQHEVMKILSSDNKDMSTLFVLHDVNLANKYCDHALLILGNGETLHGSCENILSEDNLTKLYQHPIKEISHQGQKWFIAN